MWFIQLRMLQSWRLMCSSCMLFCCCNCFSCNDTFEGMQTKYNSVLLLRSARAGEFTCVQTDKIFIPLSSVYSQWWDPLQVGVKFAMCVGEFLHKHKHIRLKINHWVQTRAECICVHRAVMLLNAFRCKLKQYRLWWQQTYMQTFIYVWTGASLPRPCWNCIFSSSGSCLALIYPQCLKKKSTAGLWSHI